MRSPLIAILAILTLVIVFSAVALAAGGLPHGTFVGKGTWKAQKGDAGEFSGEYKSEVTITADAIISTFETIGEKAKKEQHTIGLRARADGAFDLLDDKGAVIGELVCGDEACKYTLTQEGTQVETTWRMVGDELHTYGTKTHGEFAVEWREVLTPVGRK